MTFSLNEVEATAKKAARGAGYTWGLAEEAGVAVRWLCAQGLDGCAALARLLVRFDGSALNEIAPTTDAAEWTASGGMLCPLVTGATISDQAPELDSRAVRTGPIAEPCLLFPFAGFAARLGKCIVNVEWPEGTAATDGTRLSFEGRAMAVAEYVSVRSGGSLGDLTEQRQCASPDVTAWKTLNGFAHRTYAPATEESRRKGAGAGMTGKD